MTSRLATDLDLVFNCRQPQHDDVGEIASVEGDMAVDCVFDVGSCDMIIATGDLASLELRYLLGGEEHIFCTRKSNFTHCVCRKFHKITGFSFSGTCQSATPMLNENFENIT